MASFSLLIFLHALSTSTAVHLPHSHALSLLILLKQFLFMLQICLGPQICLLHHTDVVGAECGHPSWIKDTPLETAVPLPPPA
uniref:Secreted protein n=1 Tax=Anguilla anguilla TaxID=7936 RepID=A0A0E9UHQ5_ANGAN